MSEGAYTPGPWSVQGNSVWALDGYIAEISSSRSSTTSTANRNLIAAAPDLLDVAREYQESVCARWCDETDTEVPHCEECQRASAAIARATGTAP